MTLGKPRNHGCRISDHWLFQEMRTLILENSLLRVVILLDKGSDIVEFRFKPLDLDFMYLAPGGIRNPTKDIPSAFKENPFIDYYSGGWNDILPNGGPYVSYQGADLGQHGEISLLPWECSIMEDTPHSVSARLWVRSLRTPFFVEKTVTIKDDKPALYISETVTSEAAIPVYLMWGQHIAFSEEFLRTGAIIDIPARRFLVHDSMPGYEPRRFLPGSENDWPYVKDSTSGVVDASWIPAQGSIQAQEMAYLAELEDGWYAITDQNRQVGFALQFDHNLYPYVWYWQQLGGAAVEYPWWGRTHTTALEPWTSYPTKGLLEAIENGTAVSLQPGQRLHTELTAMVYTGINRVKEVSRSGEVVPMEKDLEAR
jgi:hypothetical protein